MFKFAGHENQPHQLAADRHRSGGHVGDAGVRALRCPHVPSEGETSPAGGERLYSMPGSSGNIGKMFYRRYSNSLEIFNIAHF